MRGAARFIVAFAALSFVAALLLTLRVEEPWRKIEEQLPEGQESQEGTRKQGRENLTRSFKSDRECTSFHSWMTPEELENMHRKANQTYERLTAQKPQPSDYVMFMGYQRTGHTLVASILDAHPSMAVMIEDSLIQIASNMPGDNPPVTRARLLTLFSTTLAICSGAINTNYDYAIPGMWQGTWDKHLSVMGEKQGVGVMHYFRKNYTRSLAILRSVKTTLNVRMHVIHVMRNPYDYIATRVFRSFYYGLLGPKTRVTEYNPVDLAKMIKELHSKMSDWDKARLMAPITEAWTEFIESHRLIVKLKPLLKAEGFRWHDIYYEDFIADPEGHIRTLCSFLGQPCPDNYVEACVQKVSLNARATRHMGVVMKNVTDVMKRDLEGMTMFERYSADVTSMIW